MKMTPLEQAAKKQISDQLNKQGYPTYSRLLDKLDLKLIDVDKHPEDVAYLIPTKATIYINPNLDIKEVSTIIRHEILHEYLTHMARSEAYRKKDLKNKDIPHTLINIAGDYEISNRGYTDQDKAIVRGLTINGNLLRGLVTEDDHPGWENKTFEEMLDLLKNEKNQGLRDILNDLNRSAPDSDEQQEQINNTENQANNIQKSSEANEEQQKEASQISRAARELNKEISQNKENQKSNNGPLKTEEQKEDEEETAKKVAELKKALEELKDEIFEETDTAIEKEKIAKKAKDASKYTSNPLNKFIDSLNNFIKKEVSTQRGATWTRMNKKYSGSGIIRPGTSRLTPKHIPNINVYFDVSGSFTSYPEKIQESTRALSTLNKYVNKGDLKINLYYVTDKVYSDRKEAESRDWGADGQAILDHINATKPDNVIVVTDSDSKVRGSREVSIPGGVWILFYESKSNLLNYINGKKVKKEYLMWGN